VTGVTPGQAAHGKWAAMAGQGLALDWENLSDGRRAEWEGIAKAGISAGGWSMLAADIRGLPVGSVLADATLIVAQVAGAVLARLTGLDPKGTPRLLFDAGGDRAAVTVSWPGTIADRFGVLGAIAGRGCGCYRATPERPSHDHESDEEGDCILCGCGQFIEPDGGRLEDAAALDEDEEDDPFMRDAASIDGDFTERGSR
jgi:hypothetical protein